MKLLEGITDAPKQTMAFFLADGSKATLSLEYSPNQLAWFYDVAWVDFAANGRRLVASPNILRQFRELIPFGIAVLTAGGADPLQQEDLVAVATSFVLLEADDVANVEETAFVVG